MHTHYFKSNIIAAMGVVLSVSLLSLMPSGVKASAQYPSMDCSGCHGMPPQDSPTRNPDTGAFRGNHQTHLAAGANSSQCAYCHYNISYTTVYENGHRDGGIQLSPNVNSSPKVANYTRGQFFNQTSIPPATLGTCSNVNCHFERTTPAWASDPAATTCSTCHDTPPADGNHPATAGAGKKHGDYYGTGVTSCIKCHPDHTANSRPFAHATSAGRRNLTVSFAASPNNGAGSYSGALNDYLPSQTNVFGSCLGTYCHSKGKNTLGTYSTAMVVPTWNGALDCAGCHGDATSNTLSGKHREHVNNAGFLGKNFGCVECHAKTVSSDTFIVNKALHVNRFKDYSGAKAGRTAADCSNIYCHSSGKGDYVSPGTWAATTPARGCNGCHGTGNSFGAPDYPNTGTGSLKANSHGKHATASSACVKCHVNAVDVNGTYIKSTYNQHIDKNRDVALDQTQVGSSAMWNGSSAATCSNVSCHSDGVPIYTGGAVTNTTPQWGNNSAGCNAVCHYNTTYSDYRKAAPLYATGSPKPNAHQSHIAAVTGGEVQCLHCHSTTTTDNTSTTGNPPHGDGAYTVVAGSTYANGDNVGGVAVAVTLSPTLKKQADAPNVSSCANVSCHPTGLAGSKAASTVKWDNKYACTDCHKVDLQNNAGYHHAMRNYSGSVAGYPTAIPGSGSAGANDNSRRCTMCHVDHNTFSPKLNASNSTYGSAGNLRTGITDIVTASAGYTNADFVKTGNGGICVSCHNSELFKDTSNIRVKNEVNSTKTAGITLNNYTGSAHEYFISSSLKRDGKAFQSNCSKCHNSRSGEVAVFSSMTTGTHNSPARRIYASLGTNVTDGVDALFCYRCHSNAIDAIGGTKKPVDGKDYYNVASMSAAAEDIWTVMQKGSTGVPASSGTPVSGNVLYFRNTAATGTLPSGWQLASGTYSPTAPAVTIRQYDMTPGSAGTAQTSVADNMTSTTTPRYAHKLQFLTPPVQTGFTWATGSSFTMKINVQGPTGATTTYTRYALYQWTSGGAVGTNFKTAANGTAAWTTSNATNTITFTSTSAVTFNPGDRILVELEVYRNSGVTGNYTMYWNGAEGASLTLPNSQTFSVGATSGTPASGRHDVANSGYAGRHKPSPTDETLSYIATNKHVSCNDCHDPHEARQGNHTVDASNRSIIAKVLKGVTGVAVTWNTANWTAPTYTSSTSPLPVATAEYQICFKCHSGANSNVTSWGGTGATAWTDIGLEFSPYNESGHPVVTGLSSYTNSTAPKVLTAAQMVAPWNFTANMGLQIMTCSDCHATDSAASSGPHGSSVKWMLAGANKSWPYQGSANNGGSTGTFFTINNRGTGVGTANGLFCLNCHPNSNQNNVHSTGNHGSYACVDCHIRVPHGGKAPRLLAVGLNANVPARYRPDGNGGGEQSLTVFKKASGPNSYSQSGSCYTGQGCNYHTSTVSTPDPSW